MGYVALSPRHWGLAVTNCPCESHELPLAQTREIGDYPNETAHKYKKPCLKYRAQ